MSEDEWAEDRYRRFEEMINDSTDKEKDQKLLDQMKAIDYLKSRVIEQRVEMEIDKRYKEMYFELIALVDDPVLSTHDAAVHRLKSWNDIIEKYRRYQYLEKLTQECLQKTVEQCIEECGHYVNER